MAELPSPPEGIVLTHFIVSTMSSALGASSPKYSAAGWPFPGDPVNVALANSWIVINGGGGPTDDKPTVILETPHDVQPGQQLP